MSENKKLLTPEREKSDFNEKIDRTDDGRDLAEVKEAQQSVSEGLNVLGENAEEMSVGEISENEKKGKSTYNGGGQTSAKVTIKSSKAQPTIEVMIAQTVTAIENELKVREDEVKTLIKNKKASPYEVNDAVRRIRFLNGLLAQLSRAAKLAEEFVIGLWKQFVGKA